MKVVLSHGRGLNKHSKDMVYLARTARALGHEVVLVNDTDSEDPQVRSDRLSALVQALPEPLVLAGFSMGAYCSVVAAMNAPVWIRGLFLIAPALYLPHYPQSAYHSVAPTLIVHGLHDQIVPMQNSLRYTQEHGGQLCLVPTGHVFRSTEEVQLLAQYFAFFLQQLDQTPSIFAV